MIKNMEIYEAGREVPEEAKRAITAGRLKGFTDINPVWRIKKLTEIFGPCGIGWWYTIQEKRMESGANGEICAFVDIDLYYKWRDVVSLPIPGTGGSRFVAKESNGLYTSDECFKMAVTDAISVAAKSIGIGADVYYQKDRDKYIGVADDNPKARDFSKVDNKFRCENCGKELSPYLGADGKPVGIRRHAEGSKKKYGKVLCIDCIMQEQAVKAGVLE